MFLLPIISKNVNYKNINNMNDNKVTLRALGRTREDTPRSEKRFYFLGDTMTLGNTSKNVKCTKDTKLLKKSS
jgi:hypothetical protein